MSSGLLFICIQIHSAQTRTSTLLGGGTEPVSFSIHFSKFIIQIWNKKSKVGSLFEALNQLLDVFLKKYIIYP